MIKSQAGVDPWVQKGGGIGPRATRETGGMRGARRVKKCRKKGREFETTKEEKKKFCIQSYLEGGKNRKNP